MTIHVNTKNYCTTPNISKTSFYHLLPTRDRAVSGRPVAPLAPLALDLLSVKQLSRGIRAIYFQCLLYLFHFNSSQQKKSKVEKIFPRKSNNWVTLVRFKSWHYREGASLDFAGPFCMGGINTYIYIHLYIYYISRLYLKGNTTLTIRYTMLHLKTDPFSSDLPWFICGAGKGLCWRKSMFGLQKW